MLFEAPKFWKSLLHSKANWYGKEEEEEGLQSRGFEEGWMKSNKNEVANSQHNTYYELF